MLSYILTFTSGAILGGTVSAVLVCALVLGSLADEALREEAR